MYASKLLLFLFHVFQPFTFSLLLNFDIFWNAYTFIDSHLVRHYNAKEFFIRKKIQPTDWFVSGPSPSSSVINLFIPRVNRRERNRKSINDYMQFIYHSNAYRNPPALSLPLFYFHFVVVIAHFSMSFCFLKTQTKINIQHKQMFWTTKTIRRLAHVCICVCVRALVYYLSFVHMVLCIHVCLSSRFIIRTQLI